MTNTDRLYVDNPLTEEEASRPFEVNGVTVSLGSFLALNDGLSPNEVKRLRTMEPGEMQTFGGGAFAEFTAERID